MIIRPPARIGEEKPEMPIFSSDRSWPLTGSTAASRPSLEIAHSELPARSGPDHALSRFFSGRGSCAVQRIVPSLRSSATMRLSRSMMNTASPETTGVDALPRSVSQRSLPSFSAAAMVRPPTPVAYTVPPWITGLPAMSDSPDMASVRAERETMLSHFGAPSAMSKAISSPEVVGTTTVLSATAGLAGLSRPACSGTPAKVNASVPSAWSMAKIWLSWVTTNTLPSVAVGALRGGVSNSFVHSTLPFAADSAVTMP
jgi:hypothetical protein